MSLFAKVLARAAVPTVAAVQTARPKGLGTVLRRDPAEPEEAQPLRRSEQPEDDMQPLRRSDREDEAQALRRTALGEEDEAQPLRRAAGEAEEDDAQALRRTELEEDAQALRRTALGEEEEAQTLRRSGGTAQEDEMQTLRRTDMAEDETQALRRTELAEEEAQTLRRTEEEEPVQSLRRNALDAPEDEASPLRRAETEEEEMQTLRRVAEPLGDDETASRIEDPELPEEPAAALALRRSEMPGAAVAAPAHPGGRTQHPGGFEAEFGYDSAKIPPAVPLSERPRVQIDQIDVTIHEPAQGNSRSGPDTGAALSRMLSGRYLGRL